MFYLAGNGLPRSAQELASSLRESLQQTFAPNENLTVRIEGGNYPDVTSVCIDLSGGNVDAGQIPPRPVGVGRSRPGLYTRKLEISGRPIRVQGTEVYLDLAATDARFDYDRDKEGRPLLLLAAAREGNIEVKISHDDLQALLLTQARAAAAKQGVAIEKAALELVPIDHRSLAMAVRLTAKNFFVRATVDVKGQLKVNELTARLSNLSCEGAGPVGTLTGNLLQPYLERFNNTEVPLTAISLGNLHLQDLQITVGSSLAVKAVFGG